MSGTLLALGFAAGAVALVLLTYGAARALAGRGAPEETRDLAGAVAFRVAALHGLILALVFAQQLNEYRELRVETAREASAAADLFADAGRFGPAAEAIRPGIRAYLRAVTDEEWPALREGGVLSDAAWTAWDGIYAVVLDLPDATPREAALRDHMLADVQRIAALRDARASHHAAGGVTALFWAVAGGGLVIVAATFLTWPATALNMALMSLFALYAGLVAFLIWALADPFRAPAMLGPDALADLAARIAA